MPTLSELLPQFQADLLRQGRQPATATAYTRDVRRFATWYELKQGAPANLADITSEHGHACRADLQQSYGLAPSTISRLLAGLRVFLAWAVTAGYLWENPLAHVAGLPVAVREPAWLARDEQQRLVAALARAVSDARTLAGGVPTPALEQLTREQAVLLTLLHTGVRISELVGLALTDVSLAENTGSLCVRSNGRAQTARGLALNVEVRQALTAYLTLRPSDRSDRLFVSQRGALGARQVQRILQKWTYAAGIPPQRLTAQTLRHTFGYNLAQAGVPLDQVAALLGYASLNPLRGYVPQPILDLQQAVEAIVITGKSGDTASELKP